MFCVFKQACCLLRKALTCINFLITVKQGSVKENQIRKIEELFYHLFTFNNALDDTSNCFLLSACQAFFGAATLPCVVHLHMSQR